MKLLFKLLMRIGLISAGPAVSSITSATQIEGTSLVHTVTLASAVAVTEALKPFSIGGVTASTPSDYTATPTFSNGVTLVGSTLHIPVGVSSFTITVSTTNDTVYEGTETYNISVGGMTNTGTLTDNDSAPTIASVSSASATEGSNIVHTVAVTGVAQASRTFAFAFSGAAVGGTDYNATPTFSAGVTLSGGNITVPAGVTSFTVTVATINNASVDGSRAYTLTIGGASGTGSISDDDAPSPAFTVTMTALSNALGTVTTQAFITGGGGGGGGAGPSDLVTVMSTALSGGTVTGTGGITTATTGIASRTSGTAPLAVFFDATGTTNSLGIDNFHDILYLWNFGDSETAWTYGTGVGDNSKNRARGGVAAHVYETAGTYTAKVTPVTVSSSGTLSYGTTTSISITVNAFSGTTYVVSSSGNFTGAPAGKQVTASTVSAALSGNQATNTRFLFKGGESFTFSGGTTLSYDDMSFGSWGTGKANITPKAVATCFSTASNLDNLSFFDLNVDATGYLGAALFSPIGSTGHTNHLMLRVDTNNTGYMYLGGHTDGVFIVGCNGQNFQTVDGYGVYCQFSSRLAVIGSRLWDATAAQHCLRGQGTTKVVISNNTIGLPANAKTCVAIRGRSTEADKTVWSGVWVEHVVVSDNKITGRSGASCMVQFAPKDNEDNSKVRNCILERNYFDAGAADGPNVLNTEGITGIVVRNNLVDASISPYLVFYVEYRNSYTEEPQETLFYNNTIYSPYAGSNILNLLFSGRENTPFNANQPSGIIWKNNLAYTPTATAVTVAGGEGSSTVSSSSDATQAKSTLPGYTIPPTTTFNTWKATSGYSINGGNYAPVFDDFFGAARTGTYDMGAVNP